MADTIWTYESLAQADNKTLEHLIRTSKAPDMDKVVGKTYNGWIHGPRGRISALFTGGKFKKGFAMRNGKLYGYNELVVDDKKGPVGVWETRLRDGKPTHQGYYRCSYAKDEPYIKRYSNYAHTFHLNYDVPELNTGVRNTLSRVIRDFAVLPNEDDYSLMLVKAYFEIAPWFYFWHSYFLLGGPEDIIYQPW